MIYLVKFVKIYKQSLILLLILNFLFFFFFFVLFCGIHGGGTDDFSEGTDMNEIYLFLKGSIAFIISLITLVYGIIKKSVKLTTFFWLPYSVILIIFSLVASSIPGRTLAATQIMRPTTLEANVSILFLIIDSLLALLFSFILSILTLRKKEIVGYMSMPLNIVVLILYALIFLSMKKEVFF